MLYVRRINAKVFRSWAYMSCLFGMRLMDQDMCHKGLPPLCQWKWRFRTYMVFTKVALLTIFFLCSKFLFLFNNGWRSRSCWRCISPLVSSSNFRLTIMEDLVTTKRGLVVDRNAILFKYISLEVLET
ncbi:hypothetical protein HPP92_027991 [Vanilla planifolia]|uniref:Uncharacterized protein n=1 Tax=Vanilla planifolia TaxID=51239 RepID=A0A835P9M7_VANPL|nr:hypothetical protein HPP92_027991 [Vanilla planifolia]